MSDTHGTTTVTTGSGNPAAHRGSSDLHPSEGYRPEPRERRVSTETKSSYKTTELIAYIAAVIGVVVASAITDTTDFGTQEAWFSVTC